MVSVRLESQRGLPPHSRSKVGPALCVGGYVVNQGDPTDPGGGQSTNAHQHSGCLCGWDA